MSEYIFKDEPVAVMRAGWECGTCKRWFETVRMSEYCCAVDSRCDRCGGLVGSKHTALCRGCRDLRDREKWEEIPFAAWDASYPLVEFRCDRWFSDACELTDHVEDIGEEDARSLMLVHSKPRYMSAIEDDYWCDDLPEDMGLADVIGQELADLISKVNELAKEMILSYWPDHSRRFNIESFVDEKVAEGMWSDD